jgi:hypothetical protein
MTRSEPHPQRCETCEHKLPDCDKEALGSRVCKKIFLEDPKALQIGIPYFINIVGCASHRSATECPAQAVLDSAIADLEREIKDQQWMIYNYSGHHKEIHESISNALRYSLNLLRGGAHD